MYPREPAYPSNITDLWLTAEPEEPITHPGTDEQEHSAKPEGESQQNIYHVYVVKEPSTQRGTDHPIWEEEEEEPPEEPPYAARAPQQRSRVLLPLVLAVLLVVGLLAGSILAYLTQASSAQVTLIPAQHAVTLTTTLAVVTTGTGGSSSGGQATVAGRALPTMTLSQATTIPTSGTGHQDATSAHGLLTFYNGLPVEQTISAGTLLTSSRGMQIVTDEDAVIPAASLPTSGQVTVWAHTLIVGPDGNLPASAVSMPCCRENVYVQNTSAFTGGQLARNFPSVTRQDLSAATDLLTASMQQSVQAAMQPQVRTGETLITPLPCRAKVSSNHAIGEEAAQVMVTLDDTCHAVVYRTQVMQRLVRQIVEQEAMHRLGTGYSLTAEVQTEVREAQQDQKQGGGVISVEVKASGVCTYQFSGEQREHLKRLIAGKSKQEATRLLLEQREVSTVSLEVKGRETEMLPHEVGRIAVLVIAPAG